MENRDWYAEFVQRLKRHAIRAVNMESLARDISADAEVFGVLKAREGYELGLRTGFSPGTAFDEHARREFPLPSRGTRQVLRVEQDPESAVVTWRYAEGGLEYSGTSLGDQWRGFGGGGGAFAPTSARIDLWHDLKHNPYRTEQVPVDESNPWPDEGATS